MALSKTALLAGLLCLGSVAAQYYGSNGTNITALFQGSLSSGSQIILPTDSDYATETTQRWTVYEQPNYAASIKPALASDVQAIVKIASEHKIPFLATGGGHGVSVTLGNIVNGIEIDLSFFKKVEVNAEANTLTVGGATTFGDVIDPTYAAGKEIATGSCSCVGFVGGSIGGGVGRIQGLHGLIADNLLSAQVVTAAGNLITVSETENSDLLWALRGAGVDFAIVLEATYRIYDHTNNGEVFNVDLVFPASANKTHFEILKTFETNMPAELSFLSNINYKGERGGLNIQFNAVYYGSEAEGTKLLQPFIDNNPTFKNISTITWNNIIPVALSGLWYDPVCKKGNHINSYTVGVKTLDLPSVEQHFADFGNLYEQYPNARRSTFFIEGLALQGVQAAPGNSTAFPTSHREITNHLLWGYNYNDTSLDAPLNDFAQKARTQFTKTSGYSDLNVYVSYSHGDEGPQAWFGENVDTLTSLKSKWDPKGLFNYMNPITGNTPTSQI